MEQFASGAVLAGTPAHAEIVSLLGSAVLLVDELVSEPLDLSAVCFLPARRDLPIAPTNEMSPFAFATASSAAG